MKERRIGVTELTAFGEYLVREERAVGTVEKYLRDVGEFARWLGGREAARERAVEWKKALRGRGFAPCTVNSKVVALNTFFRFVGWEDCRVKTLRLQRRMFRSAERELKREEYRQLLTAAEKGGKRRLFLLMETICATGIRVSEVEYMTVEAARLGRTDIQLKGKVRTILLPGKLCRALLKYAKKQKIVSGKIFLTRNGTALSRRQIWAEMKALCREAGVAETKVFPHNLRHLFARSFYQACRDIVQLADVLGHSSIETTRIYLVTTGAEHARLLETLRLLL